MKKITTLASLGTLLPFAALAHEGHGHTHGFTITHYFVEPEHLAVLLALLAAGLLLFARRRKRSMQKE